MHHSTIFLIFVVSFFSVAANAENEQEFAAFKENIPKWDPKDREADKKRIVECHNNTPNILFFEVGGLLTYHLQFGDCDVFRTLILRFQKYKSSLQWEIDEFKNDIQNQKTFLECVGKVTCKPDQLEIELLKNRFDIALNLHNKLRECMTSKFVFEVMERCNVNSCEVKESQECLEASACDLGCSEKEVKDFSSILVTGLTKECNLDRDQMLMDEIYERIEKLERNPKTSFYAKAEITSVPLKNSLDA